jgi:gamma-glutamyl hydrolase
VLFPGGDGDNYEIGKLVFDQIVKYNDEGHFYPAWGTCLGYEDMVAYTATAGNKTFGIFELHDTSLKLHFDKDPHHTRMYEALGDKAFEFEKNQFLYNGHHFAVSPEEYEKDEGLNSFWDVTAHHLMPNGTAFVASIESKNYPIFAT